jgi:LuxR family maltose regulon positive regulatory protein
MRDTRERHRLTPVSVRPDAPYTGLDSDVTTTSLHWPPRLTLVKGASTPSGEQRDGVTPPRLALGDSRSAIVLRGWFVQSLLLEAIVRDEVGEPAAAHSAVERALELAEHDRVLSSFLVHPVADLLQRHARGPTAYGELISEILGVLAGLQSSPSVQPGETLREPLTDSELRVLRLLATDLPKREIGNELYVSVNTIKTHVKHLYAKLDVQTRRQAVERARALGLLTY